MTEPTISSVLNFSTLKALREAQTNVEGIHTLALAGVEALTKHPIQSLKPHEIANLVRRLAEFKMTAALSAPEVVAAIKVQIAVLNRELTSAETMAIVAKLIPDALTVKLR